MKKTLKLNHNDRLFVVGDLHGEVAMLMQKLDDIGFDKSKDTLVSVGDLVDRGENSPKTLELIREDWFHSVRGNHEDMMIRAVMDGDERMAKCWFSNGGNWYWSLYGDEKEEVNQLISEAQSLPYWIEVHHKGHVIVACHADWPSNKYPDENIDLDGVIWSRERINTLMKEKLNEEIKGADMFVFGHTPLRDKLHVDNCMWIDTGAVFGKELTVVEL